MAIGNLFQRLGTKAALCAGLVMAADWFFYDQPFGWTVGIYSGLILGTVLLTHGKTFHSPLACITIAACLSLVAQMINAPTALAIAVYALGVVTLMILSRQKKTTQALLWLQNASTFIFLTPSQWYNDCLFLKKLHRKGRINLNLLPSLRYAVLPVLMTGVFILLFQMANPVIANIIAGIDLSFAPSPARAMFWLMAAAILWGILRPRFAVAQNASPFIKALLPSEGIDFSGWLNRNSVVISLGMFNLLFAIENTLDILFLWSGKALPDGISYATYAHDGAYPLIFTTLIAAVYALITSGDEKYQSPLAQDGVYLWIAQNIFLIFSAMNRTLHYIDTYSLTYLRLAALIWMGLIAVGIVLVVLKIAARKSNLWLINANVISLVVTLYSCCFPNFDRIIADYNVHHAREVTGQAGDMPIDVEYLRSLGPDAIPALQWLTTHIVPYPGRPGYMLTKPVYLVNSMIKSLQAEAWNNWRSWTWRKQSLLEELVPAQAQAGVHTIDGTK